MRAVLPRLILALVFAIPPFLPFVARSVDSEQRFTLVVSLASSTTGILQVFPDVGTGYHAEQAMTQGTQASSVAHDYRLPIGAGAYSTLRIDPGAGPGTYSIERISVLDSSGALYAAIPLSELTPAHHLTLVERTADIATFVCPPDGFDPQIIYAPKSPLLLVPERRTVEVLARWFGLYVAIGFALLWVAQLAVGRAAPMVSRAFEAIAHGGAAHPQISVLVAALVATSIAMYPLLFFGRSLVSPNNGGVALLYDQAPYAPGSWDVDIEDVRGVDVGAIMWAFVPYSMMQRRALAEGEWPLWNRYNGPGLSLWGQAQTFLLDPVHWLTFVGGDPAPGWDLKFAAHRSIFAWGVGAAALAATGAWVPAALAASTAPFAGIFASRLNHPASFSLTYAPWVLAGWFMLAYATTNRRRAGASLLLALASALVLLASPPKEGTAMLLVTEITGVTALLLHVGFRARALRTLAYAVVAGVAAMLLTMPHWLVFLDTLRESATNYDIPHVMFANSGFLLLMMLGPLGEGMPLPALHALSLALVVAALLSPMKLLQNRAMLACALGGGATVAFACGVVPESVLLRVPFLANIGHINITFLTVALVPLLILSAAGAAALLEASRARVFIVTLGIAVVGFWVLRHLGGMAGLGRFSGWLALGVMGGAALIPITMLTARRGFPRVLPVAALAALFLLLLLPGGQQLETGVVALDRVLVQPRPRVQLAAGSPTLDALYAARSEPSRTQGVGGNVLLPGSQALYDLEGVGGPDALYLRMTNELLEASGGFARQDWLFQLPATNAAHAAPLLDMLNVEYFLARWEVAPTLGLPEPIETDFVRPVRRPSVWPRAFFVDRVGTYTTASDLLAQARRAGGPIASILGSDARATEIARSVPSGSGEVVRGERYTLTTNTTTFHLRAPHAGVAVLSESYMPDDFIATLNGQPVPYFRVNHAFKGVAIPGAGDWEVRFQYRPHRWNLSLAAAAVGALILVGLAFSAAGLPWPERSRRQADGSGPP